MKSTKYLEKMVWELYREIYKNSTPSADFDELMKNAPLDDWGRKDISFRNYTIKEELYNSIIEKHFEGKRLTKYEKSRIKATLLFGATPKFEKNETAD